MRLYLAGPMAGLPDHNFPAFMAEAARLRALGYHVENPAEINHDHATAGRATCMRRDLKALMTCEVIALMDGWHQSAGAHCERDVAVQLNITVVMARDLVDQVHREPARIEDFDPATSVVFDDGFNGRKTIVDLAEAAIRADGVMRENAITAKLVEMGWTPPGKLDAAQTEAYAEGRADEVSELSAAMRDLIAERRRVVDVKGYTPEHDDEHTGGTIALAGICYALAAAGGEAGIYSGHIARMWPWEGRPTGERRTLLLQGAGLLVAEVEREDRAAARGPWIDHEVHSEVMR